MHSARRARRRRQGSRRAARPALGPLQPEEDDARHGRVRGRRRHRPGGAQGNSLTRPPAGGRLAHPRAARLRRPVDPSRRRPSIRCEDAKNVDADLIVSDMVQIEKRMERLEKDLKKMQERRARARARAAHRVQGAARDRAADPRDRPHRRRQEAPARLRLPEPEADPVRRQHRRERRRSARISTPRSHATDSPNVASRPNTGATAICGKVEAELAEMSDEEAAEFLSSYGLTESGLARLIRKTYELLGLISFFTVGEDECRAWTVPRGIARAGGGRRHPLGPRKALHPRRDDPLGRASRSRLRGQRPLEGHAAPRRQGLHRPGRRRHAHPPQRVSLHLCFTSPNESHHYKCSSRVLTAALANGLGGAVIVQKDWERRYLRYFVALGAGFMLGTAFLEMLPESISDRRTKSFPADAGGLFSEVHFFEHTVTGHFHFGEETPR